MTVSNALASRAMIITLSISQWSGRKLDRSVTDETNKRHGAADDAGRYNKALLPPAALADVQRVVGSARQGFIARTLPWVDDGSRILSNEGFPDFTAWANEKAAEFEAAVSDFLAGYDQTVRDAAARLGDMFDANDYPNGNEISSKFSFSTRIMPIPTGSDFRVDLSGHQADQIRAQIEESVQRAAEEAQSDIYRRANEVLSRMVERLTAYRPSTGKGDRAEGLFRDSLVSNVAELVATLPSLNILGDKRVAELAERMARLTTTSPDDLRRDADARKATADAAQEILDEIGGLFA